MAPQLKWGTCGFFWSGRRHARRCTSSSAPIHVYTRTRTATRKLVFSVCSSISEVSTRLHATGHTNTHGDSWRLTVWCYPCEKKEIYLMLDVLCEACFVCCCTACMSRTCFDFRFTVAGQARCFGDSCQRGVFRMNRYNQNASENLRPALIRFGSFLCAWRYI